MGILITDSAGCIGRNFVLDWLAQPAESFQTGIRKTVQWYLDNQEWVAGAQSGNYRDWLNKHYGEQITV